MGWGEKAAHLHYGCKGGLNWLNRGEASMRQLFWDSPKLRPGGWASEPLHLPVIGCGFPLGRGITLGKGTVSAMGNRHGSPNRGAEVPRQSPAISMPFQLPQGSYFLSLQPSVKGFAAR
jgi:hypothetical protein